MGLRRARSVMLRWSWLHFTRLPGRAEELHQVLREGEVEGPVEHHTQLLLEARELGEIDRAPQPPGGEAREVDAEDARHAGAPAERGELPEGREAEAALRCAPQRRADVAGGDARLAQRVLGGRRMEAVVLPIRNRCRVAEREHAREAR